MKLEDEETGDLHYTNVACRYFDQQTCRCMDYDNRATINPQCMQLDREHLEVMDLMPSTCAYRVLHEGRRQNGNKDELSVSGKVVSEIYIHEDQLPEHIVEWIKN